MIDFWLAWGCAALSLALSPGVEPDTAVAVAIGLVHGKPPHVAAPVNDPGQATGAARPTQSLGQGPRPHAAEPPVVAGPPACDEHGCSFSPRRGQPRRWFGIRR